MVVVKLCSGNDIRRITIADNAVPSFSDFEHLVSRLYCEDGRFANRGLQLIYTDDEGDSVNVTSTTELLEAVACANRGNRPLRLQVKPTETTTTTCDATPTATVVPEPVAVSTETEKAPEVSVACVNPEVKEPIVPTISPQIRQQSPQQPRCYSPYVQFQQPPPVSPVPARHQETTYASPFDDIFGAVETVVKSDEVRDVVRNIEQLPNVVSNFFTNVVSAVTASEPSASPTGSPQPARKSTPSPRRHNRPVPHQLRRRDNSNSKPIHSATCDVCQRTIQGIRYKCAICADYDLCETCEERAPSVHDQLHAFIKIRTPNMAYMRALPLVVPVMTGHSPALPVPSAATPTASPSASPSSSPVPRTHGSILASRFVADVTLPDGSCCPVNSRVTKVWRLQNSGTVAWPADAVLTYASGHAFEILGEFPAELTVATPDGKAAVAVLPGATIDVPIELVVPRQPGRYASVFVLKSASAGGAFGHRVWVDIVAVPQPQPVLSPQTSRPVTSGAVEPKQPVVPQQQQQQQQHQQHQQRASAAPVVVSQGPKPVQPQQTVVVDKKVRQLVEMGFGEEQSRRALQRTKRNIAAAIEYLLRQ
eukprot:TRINITY_DN326_c0_g1_i1.p1 TRINITY_DN326_c0_g1~~TRINITY_DN326_c0_g1_i1.p1  ORF type:complete len:593 (-),score=90.13 TRINITY_DN326_c0_g1_i1:57-1835(-)